MFDNVTLKAFDIPGYPKYFLRALWDADDWVVNYSQVVIMGQSMNIWAIIAVAALGAMLGGKMSFFSPRYSFPTKKKNVRHNTKYRNVSEKTS
jgi:hypothetical protein